MVLTFIWATGGLIADAKMPVLFDTKASVGTSYWIYVATALPVCLASFGFHGNVSSLLKYFKGDAPKVAKSIWTGTLIALVIYVLWQIAIQGNLPRNEFAPVIAAEGQVSVLIETLSKFAQTGNMDKILSLFSYMAIATSFLGVTFRSVRLHRRHLQMERQHLRPHQDRRAHLPAAPDFLPALPHRLRYRHRLRRPSGNRLDRHHPRHAALPFTQKIRRRQNL